MLANHGENIEPQEAVRSMNGRLLNGLRFFSGETFETLWFDTSALTVKTFSLKNHHGSPPSTSSLCACADVEKPHVKQDQCGVFSGCLFGMMRAQAELSPLGLHHVPGLFWNRAPSISANRGTYTETWDEAWWNRVILAARYWSERSIVIKNAYLQEQKVKKY